MDACLGGFCLPFVRRLGRHVPPFDFSVPGVTSISVGARGCGLWVDGYWWSAADGKSVWYCGADARPSHLLATCAGAS